MESKKNINYHNNLIAKWNEDFKNNKINLGLVKVWNSNLTTSDEKRRLFEIHDNNIICFEKCLVCSEKKIVSPLFFYFKEYKQYESGKEIILNSPIQGCRECSKKYKIKKSYNQDEYIRRLLSKYPKLTLDWYKSIKNICAISNMPLNEKSNSEWRVSIQNNLSKELKKKYKKGDDHFQEHCVKVAFEFNVAEYNTIKTDLISCYKNEIFPLFIKEISDPSDTRELIANLLNNYNNTPEENGVKKYNINGTKKNKLQYIKELYKYNLKSILSKQCNMYKDIDRKRGNYMISSSLTPELLLNKLILQNMKCFYTQIPFSLSNDKWNYWSLERIDNKKNHSDDNTVLICRIFNTKGQLNRKKLLYALLNQSHVPLTGNIKIKIKDELNTII
jgi:hypothetical protein